MDNLSIFTFYSNYCLNIHVLENIKIVELWVHEKYKSHYISSCADHILLTFAVFPVSGPLVDQSEMYGKHVVISSNLKGFFCW